MFKVMIVDDEIYVVALIQKLIDWEKFQMRVEATANDGIRALELVKEIKPDLVIVDIRMPGHDGIAFMDKVREFNAKVKFIVISGHKQFDYAKGAMRNNVEDYLLKPINKDELEQVLGNVYRQLLETRKKESERKAMEEELDSSKRRIRGALVRAIMREELSELPADLSELNRKYLTNLSDGDFRMVSLVVDAPEPVHEAENNDLMLTEMHQAFREALRQVCLETVELEYENMVLFLVNYGREQEGMLRAVLGEKLQQFSRKVEKFRNLSVYICMGSACAEGESLKGVVESLWRCMLARTVLGSGKLIEQEDIRESEDMLSTIWELRRERFRLELTELNEEGIRHCIKEMFSKAFYGAEEDSLLYYKLYMLLVEQIYEYFSNIGICKEDASAFRDRFSVKFVLASSSGEYARILCSAVSRMIEENQLSDRSMATPSIRIVKRYIREHYQEEISLGMAASVANISPVYLSRLFKKEEGINFLDYLNQYRIEVAKKLLQDVRYSVIDVADQSGFKNTRYFSKIFKKNVGITPTEYRKRQVGKDEKEGCRR